MIAVNLHYGGGIAGMPAALVEKSLFLSGYLAGLDRLFPTGEKAAALLQRLAREVPKHADITVYAYSQATGCEGRAGNFKVGLHTGRKGPCIDAGRVDCQACPFEVI